MINNTNYTAVIRTLGTGGEKYQILLNSLMNQTLKPKQIIVYLAEGYNVPKESVNFEQIVFVRKGMVAQRALKYVEVDTQWMLMLDDDIKISPTGVEEMFDALNEAEADVCAFDAFPHKLFSKSGGGNILRLSSIPRLLNKTKGYTINFWGADCYNIRPGKWAYSTSNSGNACLIKKLDFLKINFQDDLWLDDAPYALPEDSVMYYKMHLNGLKLITLYSDSFVHLDGRTSQPTSDKVNKITYSNTRNGYIFNELYLYPSYNPILRNIGRFINWGRRNVQRWLLYVLNRDKYEAYLNGLQDAKEYLKNKKER